MGAPQGCLQVGDAFVHEPGVGPGGLEPFLQRPVLRCEFADASLKGGVVGGQASDGVEGVVGLQIADATEQVCDGVPLLPDLGVGCFERVFGVAGSFPPGLVVALIQAIAIGAATIGGALDGVADLLPGGGVLVEERSGDVGFSELEMIMDPRGVVAYSQRFARRQ